MRRQRPMKGMFPICLILMLALGQTALAQALPDLYVLSVGIDKYQVPVSNLQGCVNDAQGLLKVFQAQVGQNFGRVQPQLLTDSQATASAILAALKNLESQGQAGDWYAIVLSGHGGITRNEWGFLAHDRHDVKSSVLLKTADRLASADKKVLIIIDACFAGQLRYAAGPVLNRYLPPAKGGIVLMISSMPEQTSQALGSFSAFAHAVEDGLKGEADYDGDGTVSLKELRRFAYNRTYDLILKKNRSFPGTTVGQQDSVIDASLSIPEDLVLVRAKKTTKTTAINDGPDVSAPELIGKSWKGTLPMIKRPPMNYELKLQPGGTYRATLSEGTHVIKVSDGIYHVKAGVVVLLHPQGKDRLEKVAISPAEFRFRFQGKVISLHNDTAQRNFVADISGRLSLEDPRDRIRVDSPSHAHLINLEAGQTYVIDLKSSEFDAYLRLEDPAGAPLAEDDDSGGGRNARLRFTAPRSGKYRVIATTFSGANGVYSLQVEKLGGTGQVVGLPSAGSLVLNVSQELTAQDAKDRVRTDSHAREYKLDLKAGTTYTMDLVSSDFDTYLRLEDDTRREIAADDDSGGNLNARLSYTPTRPGTYYAIATSYRPAVGRYTFTVRANGGAGPVAGSIPVKLTQGTAVMNDRLTAQDSLDTSRKGSYRKVYTVPMDNNHTYTILLRSAEIDAFLRIENASGQELAFDDDSGGGANGHDAKLVFRPTIPGTYRVIATSFDARASGAFSLSIDEK